jgi:hypothetical protein
MGWIGCVRREKCRHTFVARTFVLIAPVWPVLHRDLCSNQMVWNIPKVYETHQIMSLGSNGVHRMRSLQKIRKWLRGTNFCINCPVRPVLKLVSSGNKTVPNAPNEYEMHQNMCLGSNGVAWVRSSRKIPTHLRGTNFCTNCTSLTRFAPSFVL